MQASSVRLRPPSATRMSKSVFIGNVRAASIQGIGSGPGTSVATCRASQPGALPPAGAPDTPPAGLDLSAEALEEAPAEVLLVSLDTKPTVSAIPAGALSADMANDRFPLGELLGAGFAGDPAECDGGEPLVVADWCVGLSNRGDAGCGASALPANARVE